MGEHAQRLVSEKRLLEEYLREAVLAYDEWEFIWGEELYDRKLVIYGKKGRREQEYAKAAGRQRSCFLVVVENNLPEGLRWIPVSCDVQTGDIYISEADFNRVWRILRRSVGLGISLAREQGSLCRAQEPEEIVDLEGLSGENRVPEIADGMIRYSVKTLPEEERRLVGRKQSLLDNPKMKYFYSDANVYYHDRDCTRVREIPPDRFRASDQIPPGRRNCPKCERRCYLREACAPHAKQIPFCEYIFWRHQIYTRTLRYFVMETGMRFYAQSRGEMTVKGKEDTWIIRGTDTDQLELWHNNYVRVSERERYITEGFHRQLTECKTLLAMLYYIEHYTWEGHLQHEASKVFDQASGWEMGRGSEAASAPVPERDLSLEPGQGSKAAQVSEQDLNREPETRMERETDVEKPVRRTLAARLAAWFRRVFG